RGDRLLPRRRLPARGVLFRLGPADSPAVGAAVWGSRGIARLRPVDRLLVERLRALAAGRCQRTNRWRREACSDVTMKPSFWADEAPKARRGTSRSFRRGTAVAGPSAHLDTQ